MSNGTYFKTVDKNLLTLFSTSTPFVFPNYQREYVWGDDEITELLEDITNNFQEFVDPNTSSSPNIPITFIGNLITISIDNKNQDIYYSFKSNNQVIMPVNSIYMVIDGQQRITTFSMIAMSLYRFMQNLTKTISSIFNDNSISQLINLIDAEKEELKKFFSIHYSLYKPPLIPLCLRQDTDKFEANAINSAANYISPICNLQAKVIFDIMGLNPPNDFIESSFHAFDIVENKLKEKILEISINPNTNSNNQYFDAAIQYCSSLATGINNLRNYYFFSHYFRYYCYIVHIEALNLDLAFDMFQSLNSTGSPLSSLEVFKPHVLSKATLPNNSSQAFNTIFGFISDEKRENTLKRTNEIAITTALVYNGKQLSRKFKEQVKYFKDIYDSEFQQSITPTYSLSNYTSLVLETIDNVVDFYNYFWTEKNSTNVLSNLSGDKEATTCLLFLRDSNHSISTSILSLFYILYNNQKDFTDAIKATTAFYVLWRSVWGTSGLPEVYRDFLRTYNIYRFEYDSQVNLTLADLKDHFINNLTNKGLIFPTSSSNNTNWITSSKRLKYEENKSLCKFCLFVYFNNQIAKRDSSGYTNGLLTKAAPGVHIYLKPDIWESRDLKELEHVAPQRKPTDSEEDTSWDINIYRDNDQHDIGNLLLLPKAINISVSNRAFEEKVFYYKIIADKSMPDRKQQLIARGSSDNIGKQTANLLLNANYISGLEPFTNLPPNFKWDLNFIKTRGEQIRQVVFEKMWDWLK